jgi:hypothetical protein
MIPVDQAHFWWNTDEHGRLTQVEVVRFGSPPLPGFDYDGGASYAGWPAWGERSDLGAALNPQQLFEQFCLAGFADTHAYDQALSAFARIEGQDWARALLR